MSRRENNVRAECLFILWILKWVGVGVWPLCSTQHSLTRTFPKSKLGILQKYLIQEYNMSFYWKMTYFKAI